MNNPIDILFGPGVVAQIWKRPGSLRRIAEVVKRQLLVELHPDRGSSGDLEASKVVSEAFSIINESTEDELEPLVSDFLAQDRLQKVMLRDLRIMNERLEQELSNNREEMERLGHLVGVAKERALDEGRGVWRWCVSNIMSSSRVVRELPGSVFPVGSIPRGALHMYRVIVSHGDRFVAYEFDKSGRVCLQVKTDDLEVLREENLAERRSTKKIPIMRRPGSVCVGATEEVLDQETRLRAAVLAEEVKPFLAVGMHPVFVSDSSYDNIVVSKVFVLEPRKIFEIIRVRDD